jgi:hypothetical protein
MEMKVPVSISVLESTFNVNPRRKFVRARGIQQQTDKNCVIFSGYNVNAILMGADPCDLTVSIPSLCEAYEQTCWKANTGRNSDFMVDGNHNASLPVTTLILCCWHLAILTARRRQKRTTWWMLTQLGKRRRQENKGPRDRSPCPISSVYQELFRIHAYSAKSTHLIAQNSRNQRDHRPTSM